ncbi:hypothetical protein HF895_03595 [Bacteroides sp. AN502]|nr:hypothetical protein [Caecibacteroides pullorum]MDC6281189.1 hypothetical protein [Caecibacteroides pullorum]
MADNSNGLMYGVAEVKFKEGQGEEKTLGWLDENGMQPAGNAPQFLDVYAAQVTDGPVDSIQTNPGSDAFTMNLIQLSAKNMSEVFGGKAEADGAYTPPANFVKTGVLTIRMHSGHNFRVFNARLSRNGWQNGMNMSNVLGFGIRVDMLKPTDGKERRWRSYPPGVEPDTSDQTADRATE